MTPLPPSNWPTQLHLGRYLLLEMHSRSETPESLCNSTGICPVVLASLFQGNRVLDPSLAFTLAHHWEISRGLLWHWQQDILSAVEQAQAV